MTTMTQPMTARVAVGVDTHLALHVAAVKDDLGRDLGEHVFATTPAGYRELQRWARGFGEVVGFGVEGTGSFGAGLSRFLTAAGERVVEVNRPNRQERRRHGKSDPADARAAARAVLSGEASATPKSGNDQVEMIRVIRAAKSSAIRARTQTVNVLRATIVTAPSGLREELQGLSLKPLVRRAAGYRPGRLDDPAAATKFALKALARRYVELDEEIERHSEVLTRLVAERAPELTACFGVGHDTAAALLVAAGDNPERMRSEASFAKLCGVSPVDASSGRQVRHRLNRGGNRDANAALYRVVLVRLRYHEPTRAYVAKRTSEGKTKREIIRCLKRYLVRELYPLLLRSGDVADVAA